MKYNIYHSSNEDDQIQLEITPPLQEIAINGIESQLVQKTEPSDWSGKPLSYLNVTRQDSEGTAFIAEPSEYSRRIHTHTEIAEKIGRLMDPFARHEITFEPPLA